MTVKTFAFVAGIVFLAFGVLGFVPQMLSAPSDAAALRITAYFGYLFGLFPVNFIDNLAHLAVGAWGIAAARSVGGARAYAKTLTAVFAAVAVLGMFAQTKTLFGMAPIHGYDVWLYAGTAIVAAFFGWVAKSAPALRTNV